jgi:hypothetical protein
MTQEEQRVSIAEACGWKNVAPRIVKNVKHQGDDITVGIWSDNGWIPDYLNDLNAMHEAEDFLFPVEISDLYSPDLVKEYASYLPHMCIGHPGGAMRATASQRAEAFLRTIGKWKEAK